MFNKTRSLVAGIAASLLVAGSTVFMASTAATATASNYKAHNVLTYGDGAPNLLNDDLVTLPSEFNGKVVTVDNTRQHLYVTDPTNNTTVDVAPWLSNPDGNPSTPDGAWIQWDYGVNGSLTTVQYDGKFWLWVQTYDANDDFSGYSLLSSDGTLNGTELVTMEDQNGDPLDGVWSWNYNQNDNSIEMIGTDTGIFFVKDEFQNNWYWGDDTVRSDLYYFDGTNSGGVGTAVDMDMDSDIDGSNVFALREMGGKASFLVNSTDNNVIEQFFATSGADADITWVGDVTTPSSNQDNAGNGYTASLPLYGGGHAGSNYYVQVEFEGYWYDTYLLQTDAYDHMYVFQPSSVNDISLGDSAVFDGAYYYVTGSGDLRKVVGSSQTVLDTGVSDASGFTLANGKMYFAGFANGIYGLFALHTDGTVDTIVEDWGINWSDHVGAGVGGKFFFQTCDDEHHCELWVNDADGTRLAQDLNIEFPTWSNGSNPEDFATVAGKVYFSAYNWETGYNELYTPEVDLTTPPVAGTLPAGNSMYSFSCDYGQSSHSVYTLDSATGVRTALGNETNPSDDCFGQPVYDPTTGITYAVDYEYEGNALIQVDMTTGLRTRIGAFYDRDSDTWVNMYGLAIDNNGVAYGVDDDDYLYTVDLATGEVTLIDELYYGETDWYLGSNGSNHENVYTLAVDPTTNTLYGASYGSGGGSWVFSIDPSTAIVDRVGNWAVATSGTNDRLVSMQFDSNGTMWGVNDCDQYINCGPISLWTVTDMDNFDTTAVKVATTTLDGADDTGYSNIYDAHNYWMGLLITRGDKNNLAAGAQPEENSLFALNYDHTSYNLTTVSTADASGVGVGADTNFHTYFGQGAWNPVTKKAYAVDWNYGGHDGLAEINPETGNPTFIGEFRTVNGDVVDYPDASSMAIDNDGNAYMYASDALYSVDLATGIVEQIGSSHLIGDIYALAVNPVNNTLYGISNNGEYNVYEFNTTTGETTVIDTYNTADFAGSIVSLQFKANGVAMVLVNGEGDSLWTGAITGGMDTFTRTGAINITLPGDTDPTYYSSHALLYIPGAGKLASTGVDASITTTAALGGFLALAAGVVLVARRRRTAE